jgi:hypothetical protein
MKLVRAGARGTWYQLPIERQTQPGIIGDCAFQVFADDDRPAQIGFTLSRLYQKQGFKDAWGSEYSYALLQREWDRGHNIEEPSG